MKNNHMKSLSLRWLLSTLIAVLSSGCAGAGSNRLVAEGNIGTTVSAVSHYGKGIGIGDFYINGQWGGVLYDGWGGGGATVCCVSLPRTTNAPTMVTVKWETYRTAVAEERWHEATIPVHFSVPPGDGDGLKVHFLPGHRVEIWYARIGLWDPEYPGPPYPRPPAPDYVPLPDEKPEPVKGK
ncbi:DUF3304 domain-containing protein [Collimonas sp. OK412]|uniref:DUF3304 domain-containing protein n=1 Tax=Collimonas sp. (strain OK412) TaxID=1801619 RepID=UPI0008E00001|nr:DUF3304 domain-containing protein [Collimonas sp. OK412]SFB83634.1 Protein of unknown function [Collimonas sp. OK412]